MSDQSLYSLLESLFDGAEELEQHLVLAGLKHIAASTISPRDPRSRAAFQVSEALSRHDAVEPFLTHCTGQFPRRTSDIELVAAGLGIQLGGRARREYLQAVIATVLNRQTLAGLRSFAVDLAGVFIEREFTFDDEPAYARSTLLGWLRAQTEGEALLLLGEPGAGKTELLYHSAAQLAELALNDPSVPVPLIITAKDLVAGKSLEGALRRQGHASEAFLAQLGRLATMRCILLIDGLDEAHEHGLLRHLTDERTRLGARVAALALSSRPAFAPTLPRCRRANLCRWSREEGAEFLIRWERVDATGAARVRAHLDDPGLAELFANPLTATLSAFTVSRWPNASPSRARLYASVYGRVLQKWPEQRAPDAAQSPWKSIAGILRELAVDCLRDQRTSIPRSTLETLLQAHAPDSWSELLDEIEVHFGILAPNDGDREVIFHDRRLMEYLAAEHLLSQPEQLLSLAREPWAHEPVRLAFGLLVSRQPDTARTLFQRLVLREREDTPGLHDHALRPVLVAIDAAGDDQALDDAAAPRLADAVFRRLTEEYSSWVGDAVARHAQRLARRSGATFDLLRPRLLDLLTEDSLRRPFDGAGLRALFTSRDDAFMGLLHRSAHVRWAACEYLESVVDDPEVNLRLVHMLFDQGDLWETELPFVVGRVLRRAKRTPSFAPTLTNLRAILGYRAQLPSCGAAIALHPTEAPASDLVAALTAGLKASNDIPAEVFEAIESTAEGREAILAHRPNWRARLDESPPPSRQEPRPLARMPYSAHCRGRAFEVLAASPDVARDVLELALSVQDNMHSYTESIDSLSESATYELLRHVRATNFPLCWVAQEQLGRRAMREPALSAFVLDWWKSLSERPGPALHAFPGRALEPLVLAGEPAAIEAYARWLPHSNQRLSGSQAHFETLIPREVFQPAPIREAAYAVLDPARSPWNLLAARRLARAWEHDGELWALLEQMIAAEHRRWLAADDDLARSKLWSCRNGLVALRGVTIPPMLRSAFARIVDEVVRSPRRHERSHDSAAWHAFVIRAILFASANGLEQDIEAPLRALAGAGAPSTCQRTGLHAACAIARRLPADEARGLSTYWADRYARTEDLALLDRQALADLVSRDADAWARALETRAAEHRVTSFFPLDLATVFQCLPPPQQRQAASSFLSLAGVAPIPWIAMTLESRKLVRLSDEILRIAFETRLI